MTKKIPIKSAIVDNQTADFYNFFGMQSTSPKLVQDLIDSAEDGESLQVDIASPGGDVFAASEIYSTLKDYEGDVTVRILGLAASAASVIAMAGDKVVISPTAQIMVHKASTNGGGNADDLAHEATVLDGIDKSIANAYVQKTGMKHEDLINLMKNETWLTAQDAVNKGFADEIMFVDDKKPVAVNSSVQIPSKEALNKFLNLVNKKENIKKDIQPTKTLRQRKLDILVEK